MGATLPGCPLFAVAHNENVAWGVTYLKGDTCDYFIEDCRPGGATGWQYRRGDQWKDFDVRQETIVRKHHPTETIPVYYNSVGTLKSPFDGECRGSICRLLGWVDTARGRSFDRHLARYACVARQRQQAMDVARECPLPTLCWVFADRDGHIGLQANGWFPDRGGGHSGLLPIPAWNERNHWRGRLVERRFAAQSTIHRKVSSPRQMRTSSRPRGPQLVTLPVPDYRKRRIVERLAAMSQATIDDMQKLQYDVVSMQARDLLADLSAALARWADQAAAIGLGLRLRRRECRGDTVRAACIATFCWRLFGHEQGIGWRRMLYLCSAQGSR